MVTREEFDALKAAHEDLTAMIEGAGFVALRDYAPQVTAAQRDLDARLTALEKEACTIKHSEIGPEGELR